MRAEKGKQTSNDHRGTRLRIINNEIINSEILASENEGHLLKSCERPINALLS